jgi:hypothetical protein
MRGTAKLSAALLGPLGLCADALEVHASLPTGERVRLAVSTPDPDEDVPVARQRALMAHQRFAEQARRLGMTQREYKRARAAGTLPPELMKRHPRSDKGGPRA